MKLFLIVLGVLLSLNAFAVRLKDLANIRGVKENQLMGYGIVVGLSGTGDRAGDFTEASLTNALKAMGADARNYKLGSRNSAAVVVTATLPPFTRVGSRIDATVSSIGSATSLEGGALMMTPLKGPDGSVYAIAQGRIPVTKRNERGSNAFQAMLSTQMPQAALLEKDVAFDFSETKEVKYQLYSPDFTTAARIAHRINEELGGKYANATDPGTVDVILPYNIEYTPVELVARIESLDIEPDRTAKVLVNRKTGTVVLGEHVHVMPVSIAHNNLKIWIREDREPAETSAAPVPDPTLPAGFPPPPQSALKPRSLTLSNRNTSIADVVTSLNEVGATPEDIVFLIQSLRSAGALVAELELK